MAQSRVKVGRLNAPTQSDLRPQAAPVETYVRPPEAQLQPNELSQFLTAITPAIKAEAEQRKVDRLKRERELETGQRKIHALQLDQQAKIIEAELDSHYYTYELGADGKSKQVLKPEYLEMPTADVLEERRQFVNEEIDKIRQSTDIDPLLLDAFSVEMEGLHNVWGKTTYIPAKINHNKKKTQAGLGDFIISQMNLTKTAVNNATNQSEVSAALKQGSEIIANYVNNFNSTHANLFTKQETNDYLMGLAHSKRETHAYNPLTEYLSGPLSKNQFGVSRYADQVTDIEKAQKTATSAGFTAAKDIQIGTMAFDAMNRLFEGDATAINMETDTQFVVNGKATSHKFTSTDYANQAQRVLQTKSQALTKLPRNTEEEIAIANSKEVEFERKSLEMYRAIGVLPNSMADAVRVGTQAWFSGDVDTYKTNDKGEIIYVDTNVNSETFGQEVAQGTEGAIPTNQSVANALGAYGQFSKVYAYQGESGLQAFFGKDKKAIDMFHVMRNSMRYGEDFRSALKLARNFKPTEVEAFNITVDELESQIDGGLIGIFKIESKDDAINLGSFIPDIKKRYAILRSTNPLLDEDAAKEEAVNDVMSGLKAFSNSDGSYSLVKVPPFTADADLQTNIEAAQNILKEGIKRQDFRDAINTKLGIKDRSAAILPAAAGVALTGVFGGEGVLANFTLHVQTNPNNDNMLDVRATEKGNPANSWILPMGISLQHAARVRKTNLIDKVVGDFQKNVSSGAEPTVTTEDDETPKLSVTPSIDKPFSEMNWDDFKGYLGDLLTSDEPKEPATMPNIFEEFPAEQMFKDVGQELKDVVGAVGDAIAAPANATTTIMQDEGFSYTPYDDMGKKSVGHGLQIESLEDDEKALIADINNVQPEESAAVVALKVQKTNDFFTGEVDGFENLPESTRSGVIQMGYQLGRFNVAKEWPKFMASLKEAAQYAEGSIEQGTALAKAKFNMLYNVAEDGTVTATKWATQTADRAMKVANEVAGDIADFGSSVFESVIPKANASLNVPEKEQLRVGEVPSASAVVDIALNKNPADAAYAYMGLSEKDTEGASAVKGFFENSVGDWNPQQQTVEEFATNQAWCAAFLTQVLRDSGVDTKSLLGKDKFNQIRAASYLKVGNEVQPTQAKAGDIMVKLHSAEDRKKYKLGVAHVGVVVKVEGDQVYYIGGNTGDKVRMSSYSLTEEDVKLRRIDGASDIPTESLPSMMQLKAGAYTTKLADKAKNLFTSMYDNIFG